MTDSEHNSMLLELAYQKQGETTLETNTSTLLSTLKWSTAPVCHMTDSEHNSMLLELAYQKQGETTHKYYQ